MSLSKYLPLLSVLNCTLKQECLNKTSTFSQTINNLQFFYIHYTYTDDTVLLTNDAELETLMKQLEEKSLNYRLEINYR